MDNYNMSYLDWIKIFAPSIYMFVLIFLMILMLFLTIKSFDYDYLVITTLYYFCLIFGISSLEVPNLPFNPFFPIFFCLFQTILYLANSFMYFESSKIRKKGN